MYNILKPSSSLFSGEYFIVEEDIKEFSTLKMDSVGRAILTVLRHCGRIKEIRGSGHTRYACINYTQAYC